MSDRVQRAFQFRASLDRAVRRKLQATAIAARYHADQKALARRLDETVREMTPQELGLFQAQCMLERTRKK